MKFKGWLRSKAFYVAGFVGAVLLPLSGCDGERKEVNPPVDIQEETEEPSEVYGIWVDSVPVYGVWAEVQEQSDEPGEDVLIYGIWPTEVQNEATEAPHDVYGIWPADVKDSVPEPTPEVYGIWPNDTSE